MLFVVSRTVSAERGGRAALRSAVLGAVLLATFSSATAGESDGAPRLLPGEEVRREIAAGQRHLYRLELSADRPALLRVEQVGVDVEITVSRPDGSYLTAVDSPLDRRGAETALLEPVTDGSYRLEIHAREVGAPRGRYEISLSELDPADVARLTAERARTRAAEGYRQGAAEARRRAIDHYREAQASWTELGERQRAADALYSAAVLLRLEDQTAEALEAARQVLPMWRELEEGLWEANTWNEIGLDQWNRGELSEARACFERALALHRERGERYGEAAVAANLCLMDLVEGEIRAGVACYQRTLPLLEEVQAPGLEGAARISAGHAWDVLGEPDAALAEYRRALELMRTTGNRKLEAQTLNNLARLRQEIGEIQQALADLGRALEIFQRLEDRRWQALVLHNLGFAYSDLGEPRRALSYYGQALDLWREVGDPLREAASLTSLGQIHARSGQAREALGFHQRAIELRRSAGDRRGEAIAVVELAQAHEALGEVDTALAVLTPALETLRGSGDRAHEAAALRLEGRLLASRGQPEHSRSELLRALELDRAAGHPASEAASRYELARVEHRLGRPRAAREQVEAALTLIEGLRVRIANPDLRASFGGMEHRAYELLVELRMEAHRAEPAAGHDRAALETAERARARTLLELLTTARAEVPEGSDPELDERRASLLRRLAAKAERHLRAPSTDEAEAAVREVERTELLRELDLVEAEIRGRNPAWAELTRPRPIRTPEIQALLDPDTLLLAYGLGEPTSYLWAVTSESFESFALPGSREIEAAARDLHRRLRRFEPASRAEDLRAAQALSRILLEPVADRLELRRLVVVADGALHYLPFGVLPEPPAPGSGIEPSSASLLEHHEIVTLPSASALALQRRVQTGRSEAAGRVAILADPVFDRGDPRVQGGPTLSGAPSINPKGSSQPEGSSFERLPASRQEAEAIAALAGPGQALMALDFAANRELLQSPALAGYRVLHLATHGVIDTDHPALSGLALTAVGEDGEPRGGFLPLPEVYHLRLGADLVVLSGCRTALGREMRGEGLVGLTRGFLYAGAPRVIASLWRVEDRATAELMTRFYQGLWLQGLSPATALRRAQLSIRQERRWRDPTFWAGWILVGDWR